MDLTALLTALRRVAEDPASDPRVATLLLVLTALAVLIPSLGLLLWATGGVGGRPAAGAASGSRTPIRRVGLPIAIAVLATSALLGGHLIVSGGAYCSAMCHHGAVVDAALRSGPHSSLRCETCHLPGSGGGAMAVEAMRVRHSLRGLAPGATEYPLPPDEAACRDCHADDLGGVTIATAHGVRMSHLSPMRAGLPCARCHGGAGHETTTAGVPMVRCTPCHDGVGASSECSVCHVRTPPPR